MRVLLILVLQEYILLDLVHVAQCGDFKSAQIEVLGAKFTLWDAPCSGHRSMIQQLDLVTVDMDCFYVPGKGTEIYPLNICQIATQNGNL